MPSIRTCFSRMLLQKIEGYRFHFCHNYLVKEQGLGWSSQFFFHVFCLGNFTEAISGECDSEFILAEGFLQKSGSYSTSLSVVLAGHCCKGQQKMFLRIHQQKKEGQEISMPYCMRGEGGRILPTRMRKSLRYLMPALPQPLTVRLVIPRVVSHQCWKLGKESRINLP